MSTIDKLAWLQINDKRVLVARSKGKNLYYLPGGKREAGESDVAALTREIREEISVNLLPTSLVFANTFEAQADGKPAGTLVRMMCYFAAFNGCIAPAAEIEEVAWFSHADRPRCSATAQLVFDWLNAKGLIN
jgi:ADP-ribose pyrophosphatase YjhB (NUDIX family)